MKTKIDNTIACVAVGSLSALVVSILVSEIYVWLFMLLFISSSGFIALKVFTELFASNKNK